MPVEISDWNDLDAVRNDLTGDYVLVNDLDSETAGYSGIGDDFEPIASFSNKFSGNFDGQGYGISGLVIDEEPTDIEGVGLFAAANGVTTIENLSVDAQITNSGDVLFALTAVLVGLTREDVEIKNCAVYGSVDHTVSNPSEDNFSFSGVVGQNGGLIESCVSGVDVTTNATQVGGLVARNENEGIVTDSYATGSVEGDERVGGLVGINNNGSTLSYSYATGSVEGGDFVGGLVGINNEGTVTDSYSVGSVTGDTNVGGLVGQDFDGTATDSYWNTETSGQSTSDGGTGLTTAEMQGSEAETNMDGFDFTNVWDSVLESDPDTTADYYPILLALDREKQLDAQSILDAGSPPNAPSDLTATLQ